MAEISKKQVTERLYAAFTAGDVNTVTAFVAADVVWHEAGCTSCGATTSASRA